MDSKPRIPPDRIPPELLRTTRNFLRIETPKKMAELLGVSPNTYSNWEAGRRPIPPWVRNTLVVLVKNVEIIEILMILRNYFSMMLREPLLVEKLQEYYPHFELDHMVHFPLLDFMFKTLSGVPFSNIEGRLEDFLQDKLAIHPTKMRRLLEQNDKK